MPASPCRRAALAILASSVVTFGVGSHSCLAGGHQHGPVYKTLDTLAGGIESAIDVARNVTTRLRGSASQACDDGCDAATIQELESMPPIADHQPHLAAPISPPSVGNSPTPIEAMPQYQTPLPPSQPIGPRATESRKLTPAQPRTQQPRLPQPMSDSRLNSRPTTANPPENGQPGSQPQSKKEDWIDGFSDEPTQPSTRPRVQRAPAETIKSLSDPFKDDPQSNKGKRSLNAPVSYWESW